MFFYLQYWCDWKYRVRRRAFELRAAKESNKEPPDGIAQLSAMETAILNIIGHKSVDGVIIKSDPLADAVGVVLLTFFTLFIITQHINKILKNILWCMKSVW